MNAAISLKPFESETKSSIWAIDNELRLEPCGVDEIDRFCAAQNLVDETDDMPAPNPVRIMTMKGDIAFHCR